MRPVRRILPSIRCALCDRPVDEIEVWRDEYYRCLFITVHCHGDRDEMQIPDSIEYEFRAVEQIMNQEGVAFATKRIA